MYRSYDITSVVMVFFVYRVQGCSLYIIQTTIILDFLHEEISNTCIRQFHN